MLWHMGDDIPNVPKRKPEGFVLEIKLHLFFTIPYKIQVLSLSNWTLRTLNHGQKIILKPYAGEITDKESGEVLIKFTLKSEVLFDEVKAGGRINLIIGRQLTDKTREKLRIGSRPMFFEDTARKVQKRFYI